MIKDWLRVMRKQWSWHNDKVTWYMSLVSAALIVLFYHLFGKITVGSESMYSGALIITYLVMLGCINIAYHGMKLLVLGGALFFVVYCKRYVPESKDKAQAFYDEAMEWRQ